MTTTQPQPPDARTLRGSDPDTVMASALSVSTPTKCQARSRLYRKGKLVAQGFPVADISEYLRGKEHDHETVIWLDLRDPDHEDLAVVSEEFGLHPVAVEDAIEDHERPKLDRYRTHLFLAAYGVHLDMTTGKLAVSELAAFITHHALITVRKDDGLDLGAVVERWDQSPDLAEYRVGYLLYGLLDYLVDGYFTALQSLDDYVEGLEDQLFSDTPQDRAVQRRTFELRKSLVLLRRVVLPMREVVNTLMRRDLRIVSEGMHPYFQDLYDHVLRVTEWSDSLRDLANSILETNLTIQGNRMNVITKKVTGWAAIVAVPTFITGYYGMNVPYPGFDKAWGWIFSIVSMIVIALLLYIMFKKKDWI
jgi:magnesium transporter